MSGTVKIGMTVNGVTRSAVVEPRRSLGDILRIDFGLTGTHLGCEHGVCGACTVLLDAEPVRSCLVLGVQANNADVTTVEGLAPEGTMNALQGAMWASHSFQCGFCIPGFLIQATALLRAKPRPTEAEVRDAIAGNICRCTGYQSIVDGILRAAEASDG